MKILPNIPGAIKIYAALNLLNKYKKNIDNANKNGDHAVERENIGLALTTWSNHLLDTFGAELHVQGRENIPEEGPVVFVGNHQGYADIVAYCAAISEVHPYGYVAKEELGKVPLYGQWIERIRSVFIKRNDPRASLRAIEEGIKNINEGFSMFIFPEGTRSQSAEMAEFKRGAFKLATKPGVPIVPVTIHGSWRMFEEEGLLKGSRIDIIIHPMVETAGIDRKAEKQLCVDVENTVREGLEQLIRLQEEANA